MARTKRQKPAPAPDDVVRRSAGSYVSGDERFEIRQSQANWYLVDRQQANEFGQELIHGPFGSLKTAQAAMAGARDIKPLLRSRSRPVTSRRRAKSEAEKPSAPASWIDRLETREAARVRRLIKALESEGIHNAEDLVKSDRDDSATIATRVIEQRLAAATADGVDLERVLEILTRDGGNVSAPLPGWALLELGPDGKPTDRRLRPRPR